MVREKCVEGVGAGSAGGLAGPTGAAGLTRSTGVPHEKTWEA